MNREFIHEYKYFIYTTLNVDEKKISFVVMQFKYAAFSFALKKKSYVKYIKYHIINDILLRI